MGGRGASSGGGGLKNVTPAQKDMIDRIKNNSEKQGTFSDLKFRKGKDGIVSFTYTNNVLNTKGNKGFIDANGKVKYKG